LRSIATDSVIVHPTEGAQEVARIQILRIVDLVFAYEFVLRSLEAAEEDLDLITHVVQLQPLNHDFLPALLELRQQRLLLQLLLIFIIKFASIKANASQVVPCALPALPLFHPRHFVELSQILIVQDPIHFFLMALVGEELLLLLESQRLVGLELIQAVGNAVEVVVAEMRLQLECLQSLMTASCKLLPAFALKAQRVSVIGRRSYGRIGHQKCPLRVFYQRAAILHI
jgi:hypothetical protein